MLLNTRFDYKSLYDDTRHQRCWIHKTANILNNLPKSSQPKAKQALHDIWQAVTKENAEKAFDLFIQTYEAKYPKSAVCLQKDRADLLAFYDYPAQHWQSIRTSNPMNQPLVRSDIVQNGQRDICHEMACYT